MYCGSLDLLEGKLNCAELLHFLFNFVPKHFVDEDVGEEDLPPLLFIVVLVLHSSFCYFVEVSFPLVVYVLQLQFLLNHSLQIPQMHFTFVSFLFKFSRQFLVDFVCAVFVLVELMPFFLVDVELFGLAAKSLLQVELLLVVKDSVTFVTPFQVEQNFFLHSCDF